ncbi:PE-PGRS family protein [Rhizobium calliandrae]|uniref:PE-PGRS family protein n=1 Tax=Rhizobium calliandrae TaxID=1312182 RepID=A0ABT7KL67_9HYPH|nr:PE-PGRS family protein [Rhizobium calliandrae]MDL2408008.1 PE-PGRS family protein [Rhizobium calliandrae]
MPIPQITDTINFTDPTAGNANAGNGGDGYGNGDIHYDPHAYVDNYQYVNGASTDLTNGDHVHQMADWDAGGGGAGGLARAYDATLSTLTSTGGAGGSATSNGFQTSTSGGDVAAVSAATTATQTSTSLIDQHATIISGMGGNGGNGNTALGGSISAALVHTDTLSQTVSNAFDHFNNTDGSIDVHHLGS